LLELAAAEAILLVRPDKKLLNETFALTVKHRTPVRDVAFVAFALQLGLELKTCDEKQGGLVSKYKPRRGLEIVWS